MSHIGNIVADGFDQLRSVKNIGAQNVGSGGRSGMLGRHAWQKVEAAYEQYRQADGLPARYDVILAYATK